jgi:hypothetical protein
MRIPLLRCPKFLYVFKAARNGPLTPLPEAALRWCRSKVVSARPAPGLVATPQLNDLGRVPVLAVWESTWPKTAGLLYSSEVQQPLQPHPLGRDRCKVSGLVRDLIQPIRRDSIGHVIGDSNADSKPARMITAGATH